MKKMLFRILAFFIDYLLVSLVVLTLSNISIFNPNKDSINDLYAEMHYSDNVYDELKNNAFKKYVSDKKITEKEKEDIKETYSKYYFIFRELDEKELSDKEIEELNKKIDENYSLISNDLNYSVMKESIMLSIISIVLYFIYFGIFQFMYNGQTLGKKLFKLKVVTDNGEKPSLTSFIIRSILVTELIFNVLNIIFLLCFKQSEYLKIYFWLNEIRSVYELVFILTMIFRDDQKSIHDLLLKTRVIRYDNKGNEIEEVLFNNEKNTNKNDKNISKNAIKHA